LARFAAVIGDPQGRAAFAEDPKGTLEQAGVALQHLPDGMVERYGGMGIDELTVIAKHCDELVRQGFYIDIPAVGRLCLF
jgi:hypothetical protein